MITSEYRVTGMTCAHCEMSVREEVAALPGVFDLQVSATTGLLTVSSEAPIAEADVIDALTAAGYSAVPAR